MACLVSCLNILLVPYVDSTVLLLVDIVVWTGINMGLDRIRSRKVVQVRN